MRALLIGPPASGKGTQGRRIAEHFAVSYLASGELLRAEVAAGTERGRQLSTLLAAGDLVADDVILSVLHDPLCAALSSGGYVLDGFPRTVTQAHELETLTTRLGGAPQAAVWFDVADDELLRRSRSRAQIEHRDDDTGEVARHRIDVYAQATAPLVDYYRSQGLLVRVDAARSVEEVTQDVLVALAPFETRRPA